MIVAACLRRRDFERARSHPGLSAFSSHRDFMWEREALLLSYAFAGVRAHPQLVPFQAFERWARLTGTPVNLDGLDEFAGHWRWRTKNRDAPVVGRLGEPGDPERNPVSSGGAQCVCIRPEVFVRWRDDFAKSGLFDPPSLDVYAAHVLDFCVSSFNSWRRPDVSLA